MPHHHHHHHRQSKVEEEDTGMGDIGKDPEEFSMCSLDQPPDEAARKVSHSQKKKESMKQLSKAEETEPPLPQLKRVDLAQKLREEFREMQQMRKESRIRNLVLGKGLGQSAEVSLKDGYYIPTRVMGEITEEEKEMWRSMDFKQRDDPKPSSADRRRQSQMSFTSPISGVPGGGPTSSRSKSETTRTKTETEGRLSCLEAFEQEKGPATFSESDEEEQIPIMEKFRCTYKPIQAIIETRMEIRENIRTSENELEAVCFPFTFEELFETLNSALIAVEQGYLNEKVTLPMYVRETPSPDPKIRQEQKQKEQEDPLYLVGAPAVLDFVRQEVLPVAYQVVPVAHSVQWMLQYTVAFLKSIAAQNKEEAEIRVELLAHCVRLLASTENFSSIALSLESKAEEYDAFLELKACSEGHLGMLLNDVEKILKTVLSFPFPQRRQQLLLVEKGIQAKLRHALLFLNEIDYSWIPTVFFQMKWKLKFLSNAFKKIHEDICFLYVEASLGFIDTCLYEMVKDSRVTGKITGGVPIATKVPRALQVEYDRVTSRLRFQVIAIALKGSGSRIVGLQLCMGARYILRQSTPEYDHLWAFSMNEPPIKETDDEEKSNIISEFYNKVRAKLLVDEALHSPKNDPLHVDVDQLMEELTGTSSMMSSMMIGSSNTSESDGERE